MKCRPTRPPGKSTGYRRKRKPATQARNPDALRLCLDSKIRRPASAIAVPTITAMPAIRNNGAVDHRRQ